MTAVLSRLPIRLRFNGAGQAGPRRLLVIGASAIAMLGLVLGVSLIRHETPAPSRAARMPAVNPLPGGTDSNPAQDALLLKSSQERAETALEKGQSYTPPLAASQPVNPPPEMITQAAPPASASPVSPAAAVVPARPTSVAVAPVAPVKASPVIDPKVEQEYRAAITQLLNGWDGRPPRTDIVLPPDPQSQTNSHPAGSVGAAPIQAVERAASVVGQTVTRKDPAQLLMPGGRGVYAHTILAVSSDSGGPIVLQADSGPIAGDRMIGSFAKEADRLVVNVNSLIHAGQTIEVKGLVVAPDSMETAVASSVDEHYLSRFLLPAAAAFVQGLGQAIAQSNTTTVVSPFGGVTGLSRLDFGQQAGVAAGVAAAQIGAALKEQAPKGPSVNLAANVGVGVMFLSDVTVAK